MAKLNERQQRLLETVRETYNQVIPSIKKLEEDYLYADYRAKSPVRDAIAAAEAEGVPFKRITEDGMGMTYPAKLRAWIQAPDAVVRRLMSQDIAVATNEGFEEVIENVQAVVRDRTTGEFTVTYLGNTYKVPSFGTAQECWSSATAGVPQGVYDLIQAEYPTWVLLEDDEDD